ncbi:hypothetical protein BZA05DRAFT_384281 [Tricharina praecox]|uniref:uncharacterized protein n=1 Tax=Tricharina praecox TaxID=43433 RepID=UPI00221F7AB4|nr:uncharacterized protein BZA05DRAFT_384281 [Tricharina praecox]KAI5857658.1 hypothetical protein BZA05DRAFT_384281 [Tricharina praecox]
MASIRNYANVQIREDAGYDEFMGGTILGGQIFFGSGFGSIKQDDDPDPPTSQPSFPKVPIEPGYCVNYGSGPDMQGGPIQDIVVVEMVPITASAPHSSRSEIPQTKGETPEPPRSALEVLQIWFENIFRTEFAWWPLPSPRRAWGCSAGFIKTEWKCRCGKDFFQTVSASNGNQSATQSQSPNMAQEPVIQSQTSPRIGAATTETPQPSTCGCYPLPIGGQQPPPQVGRTPTDPARTGYDYVILCVETVHRGRKLGHVELPQETPGGSLQRTDGQFFRRLRIEYCRLRPWVSIILTFKALLYFKFVKIDHFPNGKSRLYCSNEQTLPNKSCRKYQYAAERPPPPIEADRMKHLFNDPDCVGNTNEHLMLILKRIDGPIPSCEPAVWGLEAVHGPSMAMIVIVGWLWVVFVCGGFIAVWLAKNPRDYGTAVGGASGLAALLGVGLVLIQIYRSCLTNDELVRA